MANVKDKLEHELSDLKNMISPLLSNVFSIRREGTAMSKKLSKDQIEAVFAKFDGNGDGKLSKEEFQQLMAAKK